MAMVSCLLFCGIKVALCELGRPLYGGMGQSLRTQEKGQVLTYRGILSDGGMVYQAQIDLKVGDSFESDSFEKELSNGPEHRMQKPYLHSYCLCLYWDEHLVFLSLDIHSVYDGLNLVYS